MPHGRSRSRRSLRKSTASSRQLRAFVRASPSGSPVPPRTSSLWPQATAQRWPRCRRARRNPPRLPNPLLSGQAQHQPNRLHFRVAPRQPRLRLRRRPEQLPDWRALCQGFRRPETKHHQFAVARLNGTRDPFGEFKMARYFVMLKRTARGHRAARGFNSVVHAPPVRAALACPRTVCMLVPTRPAEKRLTRMHRR